MSRIQYIDDRDGNFAEVQGSDRRFNTSSRSASRIHYVSRDDGQAYSWTSHDPSAAAGTFVLYLQNTDSTGTDLFIDKIILGGVETVLWKVFFVTGTAAGGSVITAINLNKTVSKAATASARGDDAITGLTADGEIATFRSGDNSHEDFDLKDAIIIGQNDAIAIEYDTGTTGIAEATIVGYFS